MEGEVVAGGATVAGVLVALLVIVRDHFVRIAAIFERQVEATHKLAANVGQLATEQARMVDELDELRDHVKPGLRPLRLQTKADGGG